MNYLTRRLRALKDIPHGSLNVKAGGEFECTPVDAEYYLTRRLAAEATLSVPVLPVTANAAAPMPPATPSPTPTVTLAEPTEDASAISATAVEQASSIVSAASEGAADDGGFTRSPTRGPRGGRR
jgi:hypothetical protein